MTRLREPWPFQGLERGTYSAILADPPWAFKARTRDGLQKSADRHYPTMGLEAIKALPVADLAADDCFLFLWATNPMLDQAFDVMKAWRFSFVTAGTWVKTTKRGGLAFGTGYVLRSANEPFLIGRRGRPKAGSRSVRSAILAEVREHSRKPDAFRAAIDALCPGVRKAELFAREAAHGWDGWGMDLGKFGAAA